MIRHSTVLRRGAVRLLLPAFLLLSGCATSSVWTPYPAQTRPLIRTVEQGGAVDPARVFGRRLNGRDGVLYRMEQGRLAQIQGNTEASRTAFAEAIAMIREADERAVVSAGRTAAKGAALVLNDNAIPYVPDGYERVMLHHGQALNFLLAGDLEGAGVEVRLAAFEQEEALKRRSRELEQAREQERRRGSSGARAGDLARVNARMAPAAERVKNSFQNAYTFYMSGVVRELLDDPGGAYIDFKKAAEIMPGNPYVRGDVLRLAEDLGMGDEAARFRAEWPGARASRVPPGQGELVVLFEDGFLPHRSELSLPVPLFNGGFAVISLPVFTGPWGMPQPLAVGLAGAAGGDTALVCDLNALAARALQERMAAIMTRQVLRAAAKAAAPYAARHGREQDALIFVMSLYSMVTERADLRSWNTLPQSAQVLRIPCPPGRHVLTLAHRGTGAQAVVEADVRPGGKTIVVARRTGGRVRASVVAY